MASARGTLDWQPLRDHLDWVGPTVAGAADRVPNALVARIDPQLADTSEFCAAYDVSLEASANCVVVEGRRGERHTYAAVLVRGTDRADINTIVRKHLDVRKISFADQAYTEEATAMQSGGITPVGLPTDWPILVDSAVAMGGEMVIGAGVRDAKLLVDGAALAEMLSAEVLPLVRR
ncbi:YbaK/EbsC family protein [Demetria terragena]|uniref:YbaK/EbsC family protein n=1 Tax=Demetria terragena TaxID=63959 RepID=UPI000477200C|nr:YbaK/EbsC family protein [Demetria terragena]